MPLADVNESPRLKAIVVNAILRLPSKRTWTVNFLVDPEVDLNDKPIHDATGVLFIGSTSGLTARPMQSR